MFVDGVVEHFENAVMQAAFIGWPDVHAGSLTHAGKPFKLVDFGGVVELLRGNRKFSVSGFGHKAVAGKKLKNEGTVDEDTGEKRGDN
jgi:hypothetical protein